MSLRQRNTLKGNLATRECEGKTVHGFDNFWRRPTFRSGNSGGETERTIDHRRVPVVISKELKKKEASEHNTKRKGKRKENRRFAEKKGVSTAGHRRL